MEQLKEVTYELIDGFDISFERFKIHGHTIIILNSLEIYFNGEFYDIKHTPILKNLLIESNKMTKTSARILNHVNEEIYGYCEDLYYINHGQIVRNDIAYAKVYKSFEEIEDVPVICSIQPNRLVNKSNSIYLIHIQAFVDLLNSIEMFPKIQYAYDSLMIYSDEFMDEYSDTYSDEYSNSEIIKEELIKDELIKEEQSDIDSEELIKEELIKEERSDIDSEELIENNSNKLIKNHTEEVLVYIFSPRLDYEIKRFDKRLNDYYVIDSISCQMENLETMLRFHNFDENSGDRIICQFNIGNSLDLNRHICFFNQYLIKYNCGGRYIRKFLIKKSDFDDFCKNIKVVLE